MLKNKIIYGLISASMLLGSLAPSAPAVYYVDLTDNEEELYQVIDSTVPHIFTSLDRLTEATTGLARAYVDVARVHGDPDGQLGAAKTAVQQALEGLIISATIGGHALFPLNFDLNNNERYPHLSQQSRVTLQNMNQFWGAIHASFTNNGDLAFWPNHGIGACEGVNLLIQTFKQRGLPFNCRQLEDPLRALLSFMIDDYQGINEEDEEEHRMMEAGDFLMENNE